MVGGHRQRGGGRERLRRWQLAWLRLEVTQGFEQEGKCVSDCPRSRMPRKAMRGGVRSELHLNVLLSV